MFTRILKSLVAGEIEKSRGDRRFRPGLSGLEGMESRQVPGGYGMSLELTVTNGDVPVAMNRTVPSTAILVPGYAMG